jgi:hypothetical protein
VTTASSTRVLAVGISEYTVPSLHLRYAATNAADLVSALELESGCSIPPSNIKTLVESQATRTTVVETLAQVSSNCGDDDVLIFFFSGHGERTDDEFFLLPVGADPTDLPKTAISTAQIRNALKDCRARGLLVILDCCRGAGFAENADRFFMTLGGKGFRLLLSASRANQPSFEFVSQKGTIFSKRLVEVLRGEIPVGEQAGVVYFSELFIYLSRRVAEDLESIGQLRTAQEPIFAGTYAGDPRLFILREVALDRIEAETPRYSMRYVHRALRRGLISVAVASILFLAGYYYYLEHSLYIWVEPSAVQHFEGDYLAVYAGDPKLNALGFPHLVSTTDIPVDALPRTSRPGVGSPPQIRMGTGSSQDIEPKLFQNLSAEWKTIVSVWRADEKSALSYAPEMHLEDSDSDDDSPALVKAMDALGRTTKSPAAYKLIDDDIMGMAANRDEASIRAITRWDPSEGINLAVDGAGLMLSSPDDLSDDTILLQRGFLEGLGPPCTSQIANALSKLADSVFNPREASLNTDKFDLRVAPWFAAILRTGCQVDDATASKVIDRQAPETMARRFQLLSLFANPPGNALVDFISSDCERRIRVLLNLNARSDGDDPARMKNSNLRSELIERVRVDLLLLSVASSASVPDAANKLLRAPIVGQVRYAAARALIAKRPANWRAILAVAPADPWVVAALAEAGIFDEASARRAFFPVPAGVSGFASITRFFLGQLRKHHLTESAGVVRDIQTAQHQDDDVQIEAARALTALAPASMESKSIPQRNKYTDIPFDLRLPTENPEDGGTIYSSVYSWAISVDENNLAQFLKNFGLSTDDDTEYLGRVPLTEFGLKDMRNRLQKPEQRISACAILSMQGTESDLVRLLSSTDMNLRQTAESYAVYNPRLRAVLSKPEFASFGLATRFFLQHQLDLQSNIAETLSRLPTALSAVAPDVLVRGTSEASNGLFLWAEDLAERAPAEAIEGTQATDVFR